MDPRDALQIAAVLSVRTPLSWGFMQPRERQRSRGRVVEAACWAHTRRKFYDLHAARPSALTTEALRRIGELYAIEEAIRGKPPDERCAARRERSRPLLDDLERWLHAALATLSRKSDTAGAILYALKLWLALRRYVDDGRIEIDNSAAERALRGVTLGRRNVSGYGWIQPSCRKGLAVVPHD